MIMRNAAAVLLLGCATACAGTDEPRTTEKAEPAAKPGVVAPAVTPDPFAITRTDLQLRPFAVRLGLVASVVGVGTDHPMFQDLRDNHVELGDYDYAHGVQPSAIWTAQKLALWVQSLKPVCASGELHSRFYALPQSLDTFIEAAYGREADELDREAFAFDDPELTAAERYELTCLAVLSSAELVLK